LECSGFVAVAYKAAYNVDVDNCSAGFLSDKKNFKQINPRKIRPGDIVIASKHCGGRQGGHVALVESYNPKTGDLVTYESSAGNSSEGWARSGRITHHKIGVDFHYAARYIGPGSDADLNS
jgi:cell wall-associated NlpC family hydrolase